MDYEEIQFRLSLLESLARCVAGCPYCERCASVAKNYLEHISKDAATEELKSNV